MQVAAHVEQHPLLQRVVEDDAQTVEYLAAEVKQDDAANPIEEPAKRARRLDVGQDHLDELRDGNGQQGHGNGHQLDQREQKRIAKKVLGNAPNDLHRGWSPEGMKGGFAS